MAASIPKVSPPATSHRAMPRFLELYLLPALRNLLRHRRRTSLALSAIGFGVIALLLAGGFIEWIFWAMRESTIQARLGHVQVIQPGYQEEGRARPFAYLLPDQPETLELIRALPHVQEVAPRISFNGLVSHGETTISFLGEGVDPARDAEMSRYVFITEGDGLSAEAPKGLILGQGLAANLGVGTGDTIVLLANTISGGINAVEATVRGLFYTSSKAFDDAALRVPIGTARQLLRTSGAHTWLALADDTEQTDAVVEEMRTLLAGTAPDLEIIPWYELAEDYHKTVALFSRQLNIVRLIVAFIIVLSISNMLVMSVLERTGEIGTLMAIGFTRRRILRLFVSDGLLLGLFGGTGGLLIGLALGQAISTVGIPMPPPPGLEESITAEIVITWPLAIGTLVLAIFTTVLAGVYPAWKASRMEIVDALRHNT